MEVCQSGKSRKSVSKCYAGKQIYLLAVHWAIWQYVTTHTNGMYLSIVGCALRDREGTVRIAKCISPSFSHSHSFSLPPFTFPLCSGWHKKFCLSGQPPASPLCRLRYLCKSMEICPNTIKLSLWKKAEQKFRFYSEYVLRIKLLVINFSG